MKKSDQAFKKDKYESDTTIELDSEIIPYFVKLSLKNKIDYQVLIRNALKYLIEQNMEPRTVWKKKR